jgi:signal transduction histidine kinase
MSLSDPAAGTLILVVDDDPLMRMLMRDTLEREGFAVIEAEDGVDALARFNETRPALMIIDVLMPIMDGYETCRQLRQRPETTYLPILVATALDDVASIDEAYRAGATDFIAKPINWPVLGHRVRYMLRVLAAKAAADKANGAKTEFLANMSHELRTPLNAIIGFAQIIRGQHLGPVGVPQYVDYVHDICDAGEHLLAMINSVLDISKVEAGTYYIEEQPVDLSEIIRACVSTIGGAAAHKHIQIAAPAGTLFAGSAPTVLGDSHALRQVLSNLLSNAVKFTPEGGRIEIRIETGADGAVALAVADTGIGMTPAEVALAIEPFQQIENTLTKHYEGAGLGLPLAKRLIELQSGWLRIDSVPGAGTTIQAWLPAERVIGRPAAAGAG